jgi:hypothetical protein
LDRQSKSCACEVEWPAREAREAREARVVMAEGGARGGEGCKEVEAVQVGRRAA